MSGLLWKSPDTLFFTSLSSSGFYPAVPGIPRGQLRLLCAYPPMAVFYVCDPKIRPSTNLLTSTETQFPNKLLGEPGFVEYTIQPTMIYNVIIYLITPTHQCTVHFFLTNFSFIDRKPRIRKANLCQTPQKIHEAMLKPRLPRLQALLHS